MSEGNPPWGAGNARPKHQLVEQNFAKSSLHCIHNAGSCARLSHWPNWWNRVYARVCLSNCAVGTPVFVHQSDSKATLVWPTCSEANSQHASQTSSDVWGIVQTKRSIHVVVRVLLPCHSNDAEYHAKVRSMFFFSRLFHRKMFSSKDCFTGHSPGMGHDASHLYTGGSWMCRGGGQVQAGLLRRGLEVWCGGGGLVTSARISLMEGVLPSRLWQPDRSWSRHAWPHARAWRSSGGSGRWWGSGAEGLGFGGLWCGRATSGKLRFHHSNVLQLQSQGQQGTSPIPEEFGVGAFLVPRRVP